VNLSRAMVTKIEGIRSNLE